MGEHLASITLSSFSAELQKLAQGAVIRRAAKYLTSNVLRNPTRLSLSAVGKVSRGTKGIFRGGGEAVQRALSPMKGLKEGWKAYSPLPAMEQRAKKMDFSSARDAGAALKTPGRWELYKKLLGGGGEHLLGTDPSAGKVRRVAESLSRSGWTGTGRATKYLPVGGKGMAAGFAGMGIPSVVNAPKSTTTGEGGAVERGLGELGSAGGMVLGAGLGIAPAMGVWYGTQRLGSRLGRVLDRVRSGSGVRDAIKAPSPTEASEQLDTIQKYYG